MFSSKKKGSKKPPKATQTTLAGSVDVREPAQINLLDSGAVKRELDEAVARVAKQAGFQEDHFVSNVKILLGLGACAIALVAQFYPRKFPDNWWLLLFCVIGYAICTATLNLFLSRFEKDSFFFTQQQKDSPPLKFVSKMPRHSTTYTLSVSVNEDKDGQRSLLHPLPWCHTLWLYIPGWQSSTELDGSPRQELSEQVTQYFHSDGYLDEARFAQDVQKLLQAMQALLSRKALCRGPVAGWYMLFSHMLTESTFAEG